jgi:4-diphosphocytidyl-2-C-methyl-D-erythritol kinase
MDARTYTIQAPAKLNIRLKITGKRPDGYHDIVSIMIPVSLFDLLEVQAKRGKGVDLAAAGYAVPPDNGNLVIRAAEAFFSATALRPGVRINLKKNIPVAAGLGGGSSDAAATLLILNEIHSRPLSMKDLHGLALRLGADVPFFLVCAPCLARGIGEILEPVKGWPEFWYVVVTPPVHVSTAWAYQNYRMKLTNGEYPSIKKKLKSVSRGISQILENDLEEVTSAEFPIIDSIKRLMVENGAEGALMSGSGPSVFGVFGSEEKAQSAKERLLAEKLGDAFLVKGWERGKSSIIEQ